MPRLFSKFATNSYPGSGLGLFVSSFIYFKEYNRGIR
jgi:hypothetical protein